MLGAAVPIAGVAGDQQAALFGQACTAPGLAKVTYGTGCFLLLHAGEEPPEPPPGLLTTVALQLGGRRTYAVEGSVFVGGAVVQWLRDGLGVLQESAQMARWRRPWRAARACASCPRSPVWARPTGTRRRAGAIFGITRGTTAAHVARAALEGVAFQVDDLVRAVAEGSALRPLQVRADGGASGSDLLLGAQADLLGVPVQRAAQLESTALGAAYLAGLAVGFWRDQDEVAGLWRAATRFEPRPDPDLDERRAAWRRAVACVRAFAGGAPA